MQIHCPLAYYNGLTNFFAKHEREMYEWSSGLLGQLYLSIYMSISNCNNTM